VSHIVSIKTAITDIDAFKAVCAELGFKFSNTMTFRGWAGMEHPCDYCVKVPGEKWDIGLVKSKDGKSYEMRCDHFLFNNKNVGQNCQRVTQMYGVHKATLEAKKKGHMVVRTLQPNGVIRLSITGRSM
jgi:hypothetical protein